MERVTAQCHLGAVSFFIPATFEKKILFRSSDNCVSNINYRVVVLKCLHLAPRLSWRI